MKGHEQPEKAEYRAVDDAAACAGTDGIPGDRPRPDAPAGDTRRQLVVEETNVIGTAYLRLDLLPVAAQPALRAHFREYLDSRLAA